MYLERSFSDKNEKKKKIGKKSKTFLTMIPNKSQGDFARIVLLVHYKKN